MRAMVRCYLTGTETTECEGRGCGQPRGSLVESVKAFLALDSELMKTSNRALVSDFSGFLFFLSFFWGGDSFSFPFETRSHVV